jgi:hypothetical protein
MAKRRELKRLNTVMAVSALLFSAAAGAQNLVPNPGFEEYVQLPCNCMQADLTGFVNSWNTPTAGTPDIISDQASKDCYASSKSAHWDSYGNEAPHTGHSMGMIMTSAHDGSYREYLGVELATPMEPGRKYYAEMYVSLGDFSGIATNNLGMAFFTGDLTRKPVNILLANPQINSTQVVQETEGWVKISGTFTATEAFTYMVIGNFFTEEKTKVNTRPKMQTYPAPHFYRAGIAAYFVDDIVVRSGSMMTVAGDTLVKQGAVANLHATGSGTYAWADTLYPRTILSHTAEYSPVMPGKKTYYVYGDNDTLMITVNVIMPTILKEMDGRKVKKGKTVEVSGDEITITVYDNNKIDGDSVTIYYGDSCVVRNLKLTKKKMKFTIKVDKENPRQIILYAVNQGSIPPNTASVSVSDGRVETNIVLSSDMKTCDSITILYKEKAK